MLNEMERMEVIYLTLTDGDWEQSEFRSIYSEENNIRTKKVPEYGQCIIRC